MQILLPVEPADFVLQLFEAVVVAVVFAVPRLDLQCRYSVAADASAVESAFAPLPIMSIMLLLSDLAVVAAVAQQRVQDSSRHC